MNEAPSVICFDLGNVIVRICRSWSEGCAAAGVVCDPRIDRCISELREWRTIERAYQCGELSFGDFARQAAALVRERIPSADPAPDPAVIAQVHRAWIRGEYAGSSALLRQLVAAGRVVAVLSNTCAEHWPVLERMEFMQYVHVPVGSHLIGACKPDAAAYAEIESRCGAEGRDILFFDDLAENVEAAARRGWRSEHVTPGEDVTDFIRSRLRAHGVSVR